MNRESIDIMFKDVLTHFRKTMLIDLIMFIMIAFFISAAFTVLKGILKIDLKIVYFALLLCSYIFYLKKIKPSIMGGRFCGWFYFNENRNDKIEKRLKFLYKRIKFIESAEYFLHMRMGELNSVLWNSKFFIPALEKLIDKGVKIEIAIKNRCDVESKKILMLALKGAIDIFIVKDEILEKYAKGHFMLTDRNGVWITDPHPPFEINKEGRYAYGPSALFNEFEGKFNILKNNGVKLDFNNLNDIEFIIHGCSDEKQPATEEQKNNLINYLYKCCRPESQENN
jgi:hypothetical protein